MNHRELRQDRGVTIPLVMPYSMLEQLNAIANDSGRNRSALIREAITVALFNGEREIPAAASNRPAPVIVVDGDNRPCS